VLLQRLRDCAIVEWAQNKTMRKSALRASLVGLGVFLLYSGFAFSNEQRAKSKWAAAVVKVDGLDEDWRADHLDLGEKANVAYAFRNDAQNLYILFVFKNLKYLSSIDATGIAIYLGPEGMKRKDSGVRFIKKIVPADQFIAMLENQGTPLTEGEKAELRTQPQHPIYEAYSLDKKGKIIKQPAGPKTDVEPPAFCATKQGRIVIYEFRIPLASSELTPAGIGAEPGKIIRVFFEWGGSAKKVLKAKASWPTPESIVSGSVTTGADETRAQEFLSSFDAMSSPSIETKKYSFWVDVEFARKQKDLHQ
jgi:hypothetical protein